jgi:hypothetical protein
MTQQRARRTSIQPKGTQEYNDNQRENWLKQHEKSSAVLII